MYVIIKFRCFILVDVDVKEKWHVEKILNRNNIEILMLELNVMYRIVS